MDWKGGKVWTCGFHSQLNLLFRATFASPSPLHTCEKSVKLLYDSVQEAQVGRYNVRQIDMLTWARQDAKPTHHGGKTAPCLVNKFYEKHVPPWKISQATGY